MKVVLKANTRTIGDVLKTSTKKPSDRQRESRKQTNGHRMSPMALTLCIGEPHDTR